MHKELIISLVIVISILGLNYISQGNTNQTVEEVKQNLKEVRNVLQKEEILFEEASQKAEQTYEAWERHDDIMALYMEHDQIEKISTALVSMQSFLEKKDDSQALDSIDRCQYLLEYMNTREKLTWDNIF